MKILLDHECFSIEYAQKLIRGGNQSIIQENTLKNLIDERIEKNQYFSDFKINKYLR